MNAKQDSTGTTMIAPDVLLTIARLTSLNVKGVKRMSPVPSGSLPRLIKRGHISDGVAIEILDDIVYVDLYVVMESEVNLREVSQNIQYEVSRAISEMVGMQVGHINIHIEDIDYPPEIEA